MSDRVVRRAYQTPLNRRVRAGVPNVPLDHSYMERHADRNKDVPPDNGTVPVMSQWESGIDLPGAKVEDISEMLKSDKMQ